MENKPNKDTGIDYRPQEYKPEPMVNDIPWLWTQPLDSGISVRGKVFTDIILVPASWGYEVKDIPFKPSSVRFFATMDADNRCHWVYTNNWKQSVMSRNNAFSTWYTFSRWTSNYIFLDDWTDSRISQWLTFTNNWFKIAWGWTKSIYVQYTAYA